MRRVVQDQVRPARIEIRILWMVIAIAATALMPGLGSELKTSIATAAANLRAS